MNTIRSTYIGWGTLIVAGGGAYYFAKQSIDADKRAKYEKLRRRKELEVMAEERELIRQVKQPKQQPSHSKGHHKGQDHASSPSGEASADPAPTSHSESQIPRSKYEPTVPYRTPKGDRFS